MSPSKRVSGFLATLAGAAAPIVLAPDTRRPSRNRTLSLARSKTGTAPAATGFFGSDLSLLQPGAEGQAAMVYVDANATWKQYT